LSVLLVVRKIGRKKVKEIADKHRLPSAKAANEKAKEEGRPVLASDGFISTSAPRQKRPRRARIVARWFLVCAVRWNIWPVSN
jgi:hypothetical protein